MNYIFLDIDGVMNNQKDWLWKVRNNTELFRGHRMFCDEAWCLLSYICKKTGAKIILSSSWRIGFEQTEDGIKVCNGSNSYLPNKLLFYFTKYDIELVGLTTNNNYTYRGEQILKYVTEHFAENDKWIVLDDEPCDLIQLPEEKLIITKWETGLLPWHCDKIINYFEGE